MLNPQTNPTRLMQVFVGIVTGGEKKGMKIQIRPISDDAQG